MGNSGPKSGASKLGQWNPSELTHSHRCVSKDNCRYPCQNEPRICVTLHEAYNDNVERIRFESEIDMRSRRFSCIGNATGIGILRRPKPPRVHPSILWRYLLVKSSGTPKLYP